MKKVYGDRVCHCGCGGLCSGATYRTKNLKRNHYFWSEGCVRRWLRKDLERWFNRNRHLRNTGVSDKLLADELKKFKKELEVVYVVPKK